jgi:hypothetical protein
MQTRAFSILIILCFSLIFNGCFQIFYDIVQHPDGTFVIRQTIGLSQEFFDAMASFSSMGDSTKTTSPPLLIDSMRHSFALRRDSLIDIYHIIGKSGISSIAIQDTTHDSTTFFSMEVGVTSADSLPGAFHWLSNASDGANPQSHSQDSDDVRLKVTTAKDWITLRFYAPPKEGGFMHTDVPGMEDAFKDLSLHYRVFSLSLKAPQDKKVKRIPGGQERVFKAKELFQKSRNPHLDAAFVMKNVGHQH